MERKIGEKFEYSPGVWLEVVASAGDRCFSCALFADRDCGVHRAARGNCSRFTRRADHNNIIFVRCEPPAPGTPETPKPSEATFEFSAKLEEIKAAPPPSEWMRGMTEAWQQEIIEAARDAFVYRFWDVPNTSLAAVMGVSEATVRRIRKKRLRKNREQD